MSIVKCSDRKTLIKILKENGFSLLRTGKHDIYSNGSYQCAIPSKRKGFSRILAERLLREAGIM